MTPDRWARLKDVFGEAVALESINRSSFIQKACGTDQDLIDGVKKLIADHESAGSTLDRALISSDRMIEYFAAGLRTVHAGDILCGRFEIEQFIGEGGMGEVYAALDSELVEYVALKTLRPAISANSLLVARFKREIQLARKVTHPNVCRTFDLFRDNTANGQTICFLTMELLEGETLAQRLHRDGAMRVQDAWPVVEQLLRGLSAAHGAHIIHRDLKSSNIMLVPCGSDAVRAVITDFGLASEHQTGHAIGSPSAEDIVGTPAYMAPEQIENGHLTPATDIYAIGVILFEMVSGRLPFRGADPMETARKRLYEAAPSPRQSVPDLNGRWESAILACLERAPDKRPQSAADLISRLNPHRKLGRRTVVGAIASAALAAGGAWLGTRPRTIHLEAEKNFKRGEEFAKRRTQEALNNAVEEYGRAVQIQPNYTAAWVGLADAYSAMANFAFMDPKRALASAQQAARKGIETDRNSARANGVLAYCMSIDVHEWMRAKPYFKRAIQLDPKDPQVRLWYASLLGNIGESQQAITQIKAGLDQAPALPSLHYQLGTEYFRAGRIADFDAEAKALVRLQPFESTAYLALARALECQARFEDALKACREAAKYRNSMDATCIEGSIRASQGKMEEAKRIASAVERYWNSNPFETVLLAALYCRIGDQAKALALLETGYLRNDSTVLTAPTHPHLAVLKGNTRFRRFLLTIGFPEPGFSHL